MIDHSKIAAAEAYYEQCGYQKIDVPWVIEREAYSATFPEHAFPFFTLGGFLPASGEQSFIQLMLEGKLPPGKYQCTTPCFRDEATYDELHLPYFYKVELIEVNRPNRYLGDVLEVAHTFLSRYCELKIVPISTEQMDIVELSSGIELGSYGKREFKDFSWLYGTGMAEPRLSQVLTKINSPDE